MQWNIIRVDKILADPNHFSQLVSLFLFIYLKLLLALTTNAAEHHRSKPVSLVQQCWVIHRIRWCNQPCLRQWSPHYFGTLLLLLYKTCLFGSNANRWWQGQNVLACRWLQCSLVSVEGVIVRDVELNSLPAVAQRLKKCVSGGWFTPLVTTLCASLLGASEAQLKDVLFVLVNRCLHRLLVMASKRLFHRHTFTALCCVFIIATASPFFAFQSLSKPTTKYAILLYSSRCRQAGNFAFQPPSKTPQTLSDI